MSSEPATQSTAPQPAPRRINRWLIAGILAVVLSVCALATCFCVLELQSYTQPRWVSSYMTLLCDMEYIELSEAECKAWDDEVSKNYPQELEDCQQELQDQNDPMSNTRFFQCLDDKGIGPKTYK